MDLDYVGPVRALLLTSHVTAVTIRFLFLSPRTMETTKEPVHTVAWLEETVQGRHFSRSAQKMVIAARIYWHGKGAALIHSLQGNWVVISHLTP